VISCLFTAQKGSKKRHTRRTIISLARFFPDLIFWKAKCP
jgi:hypothetical protein